MSAVDENFITPGIAAKLSIEPTSPNPGPTFPIQVAEAVSEVMKSTPQAVFISVPKIMKRK